MMMMVESECRGKQHTWKFQFRSWWWCTHKDWKYYCNSVAWSQMHGMGLDFFSLNNIFQKEGNRKMGYKNMMGLQPHLSRVTFTEITSRTTLFFMPQSYEFKYTLKDYTYRGCWKSMVHSIFWAYSVESSGNRITISYGACSRVQYLMVFLYSHWNECIVFLCFKRLTKGQKIRPLH